MAEDTSGSLIARDLEGFGRLGIPPELLIKARVRRVSDAEARTNFGMKGAMTRDMSGIVFPYFVPGLPYRVTARLRRDNPEIEDGKSKNKYISPYGDGRHLYFPPDSANKLKSPEMPMVLVEAEKSVLALTAWAERRGADLLPVGLGGCWGWRGRIGKVENARGERVDETGPLPDLSVCNGRKVFILFDANVATNPKVGKARRALAAELHKRDCQVRLCSLPVMSGVNGPDDFIAICGDHAMAEVLEKVQHNDGQPSKASRAEAHWPDAMSPDAFYGLAGDFVRLVLPETEADPHALLLTFLVGFGSIIGRAPFYQVEATKHFANLFTVIVGDTAKARKGTATDRAMDILGLVDPEFMRLRKRSGLSSGEGLIQAVRDPREEDVPVKGGKNSSSIMVREIVDNGEPDKRLLVVESEFGSVLQQGGRDGNILSEVLRNAWDGKPLRVLARSNKDSCEEPHISMIGNITLEDLERLLTSNDKANGFGNRFLWCCAKRSKKLPHGGKLLEESKVAALVSGLKMALEKAQTVSRIQFDVEATLDWERAYHFLTENAEGILGTMTARAEAQVVRLASLYALLDCTNRIGVNHLKAALEVWNYCENSVRFIFGEGLGDDTADRILRLLRKELEGLTRTEISRAFGSHKTAAELDRALDVLERRNLIVSERIETGGAPAVRWRALA